MRDHRIEHEAGDGDQDDEVEQVDAEGHAAEPGERPARQPGAGRTVQEQAQKHQRRPKGILELEGVDRVEPGEAGQKAHDPDRVRSQGDGDTCRRSRRPHPGDHRAAVVEDAVPPDPSQESDKEECEEAGSSEDQQPPEQEPEDVPWEAPVGLGDGEHQQGTPQLPVQRPDRRVDGPTLGWGGKPAAHPADLREHRQPLVARRDLPHDAGDGRPDMPGARVEEREPGRPRHDRCTMAGVGHQCQQQHGQEGGADRRQYQPERPLHHVLAEPEPGRQERRREHETAQHEEEADCEEAVGGEEAGRPGKGCLPAVVDEAGSAHCCWQEGPAVVQQQDLEGGERPHPPYKLEPLTLRCMRLSR